MNQQQSWQRVMELFEIREWFFWKSNRSGIICAPTRASRM